MLSQASGMIAGGQARAIVCYRSLNGYSGTRYGRAERSLKSDTDEFVARGDRAPSGAFAGPFGLLAPGQIMAMWASRYAFDNELKIDDVRAALCQIAVQQRAYANKNPYAFQHDRTLSRDEYFAARMIAEPLCLYDFALETDGAAAIVVTSADLADHSASAPAWVRGAIGALFPYAETIALYGELRNGPQYRAVAQELFKRAGLSAAELSAAMLYDATTMTVLLALEAYGLCGLGEATKYLTEVGIGPESPVPVNTHGGHLSEGYVHGVTLALEAVRQLRGASHNQLPDMHNVLCASGPTGYILSRDR
jgi:acetyl-CoA acetyltransferase